VPPPGLAVKLKVDPVQSGELFETVGAAGTGLIVTLVVAIGPKHPPILMNTE
jgi:hypothetical protein